jgi:palmitoyltransferase ZDHHC2/15/20
MQEEQVARVQVMQHRSQSAAETPKLRANFCRKCNAWKPARSHHCSVMGRCILKLDHYCLWIVNCVGLLNQKFFLIFLFYSTLACTEAAITLIPVAIHFILDSGPTSKGASITLFTTVFSFSFSIALMVFITMHWDMLAKNYTSIEEIDHSVAASWPHDHGLTRNVLEVFGRRCAPQLSALCDMHSCDARAFTRAFTCSVANHVAPSAQS